MSMIQTETPYFQPIPKSPVPYRPGLFPSDPSFDHCESGDTLCAMAWGARILDSETVDILSAGIYAWFNGYSQACVGTKNCQQRALEVVQSFDLWPYNLCSNAIVELISPHNSVPTMAADNQNGLLASVLAWLRGARDITGPRDFEGFRIYEPDKVEFLPVSDNFKTALAERIECHEEVESFQSLGYRGSLENQTLTDLVCQTGCGTSLADYVSGVRRLCGDSNILGSGPAQLHGARMYAGYKETCLRDTGSGRYCNDVINEFTVVESIRDMPRAELCSFCNVERLAMMQRTAFSSLSGDTHIQVPDLGLPEHDRDSDFCLTEEWYTTSWDGESCEKIAWAHVTSSAALFMANQTRIISCSANDIIPANTRLCIPPSCGSTYLLGDSDTCAGIGRNASLSLGPGDVARFNSWVGFECSLLQKISYSYGAVVCLGPLLGEHELDIPGDDTTRPPIKDGFSDNIVPPPTGATVAEGTTPYCGSWHIAKANDTCVRICVENAMDAALLMKVNPSLGTSASDCTSLLQGDKAYCVAPYRDWERYDQEGVEEEEWVDVIDEE